VVPYFDSVQLLTLFFTLMIMFALRGGIILETPAIIWQMAIPVVLFFFVLLNLVFFITRKMSYNYADSSTMVFHCTGPNFELAIAIALTAFASMLMVAVAVSTFVGSLIIEIPVMLALVSLVLRRRQRANDTLDNAQKTNSYRYRRRISLR
jgi:ACR3 family arsenite transporter